MYMPGLPDAKRCGGPTKTRIVKTDATLYMTIQF